MTLDEMLENYFEGHEPTLYGTKQVCLKYAESLIPEEIQYKEISSQNKARGFNACRTQILSRIEEDSK